MFITISTIALVVVQASSDHADRITMKKHPQNVFSAFAANKFEAAASRHFELQSLSERREIAPMPRQVEQQPRNGTSRIAIGDSPEETHRRIVAAGGKEIGLVGILAFPPDRLMWYELKDGTCLCVHISGPAGQPETIRFLTLGEPGKGYGDKIKWLEQKQREVTFVELESTK